MTKQLLYEEIMASVAKTVKRLINEAANSSNVTLGELRRTLEPLGWTYEHRGSDNATFKKGHFSNFGHLKHIGSNDNNRIIDIAMLARFRKMFIEEFYETGDLTTIKAIPWKLWNLNNPLDSILKNIDPETGKPYEKDEPVAEPKLNIGQQLNKMRQLKAIKDANSKYINAGLYKIDYNNPDSAYIMMMTNKFNRPEYNTCRAENDRRPILKDWTTDYECNDGVHYFGKDDLRIVKTKFYKVLPDGTLEKKVSFVNESLINF